MYYELTLISVWISNYTHYKVWDEITHPFPNFNAAVTPLKFTEVHTWATAYCSFYTHDIVSVHDDVIKWKHFPRYWPFVRGIHRGPIQRPVTRSFGVFCDLRPNKRLSKQWWGWWFETPSRPLWRHRNGFHQQKTTGCADGQHCADIILYRAFIHTSYMKFKLWHIAKNPRFLGVGVTFPTFKVPETIYDMIVKQRFMFMKEEAIRQFCNKFHDSR